ncbi:MAG: hypothetical protein U9P42_02125 [Candidatus Fermentibacteria bacterium]|nr:hypothetical protein [Candidatus Fermentibacteria bacterium]
MKNAIYKEQLTELWHSFRRKPELSRREENTAKTLIVFLQNQWPDLPMGNLSRTEEFPATANSELSSSIIKASADHPGYKVTALSRPFLWSGDSGHFTEKFSCAMFAFDPGLHIPALHSSSYDFPESLIPVGVAMFMEILER